MEPGEVEQSRPRVLDGLDARRTAIVIAGLYLALLLPRAAHLSVTLVSLVTIVLAFGLVALSIIDVITLRLPNWLTLPLLVGGLAYVGLTAPAELSWHAGAAATAYAGLWLLAEGYAAWRGRSGLGLGDVKLFAAAGAWLGFAGMPSVLLIGSLAALAIVGIARLSGRNIAAGSLLPFGPFIAIGFWIVWLYGPIGVLP